MPVSFWLLEVGVDVLAWGVLHELTLPDEVKRPLELDLVAVAKVGGGEVLGRNLDVLRFCGRA